MARQRFSRGLPRGSQRRLTSWTLGPGMDTIAGGDPAQFTGNESIIIGSGLTSTVDNVTVVRLRGMAQVQLITASASRSGFHYAIGCGIVSLDAFTAGVASVPSPFDDVDWPGWIWHQFGMINSPIKGIGTASGDFNQNAVIYHEIDSKAMRKLRINEVFFAVAQAGEITTATMDIKLVSRALFKLP